MKKLLFFLAFACHTVFAQNILVEKVEIRSTIDKDNVSNIPRLNDLSNPKNPIVAKINSYLLESFELTSYKQSEITEFRWSGVEFKFEVKSGIAWIQYTGEYYGAYPTYLDVECLVDL